MMERDASNIYSPFPQLIKLLNSKVLQMKRNPQEHNKPQKINFTSMK